LGSCTDVPNSYTQTTERTTSTAVGRIYAIRPNDTQCLGLTRDVSVVERTNRKRK